PDPEDWKRVDFPLEIAVELTNFCNLRCVMCPVPNLRRNRGFIDRHIFEELVGQLVKESGFVFLPQGFGESLLHPQWKELLRFARGKEIQPIAILTNGMLLSGDRAVTAAENADIVIVTLDGSKAETYESVRVNSNFEQVTQNVSNLLLRRGDLERPHFILRMIRMQETENEIDTFRMHWSKKIGKGDLIQISDCIDWAGNIRYPGVCEGKPAMKRHPCRMLWKNLTVYHDGHVSPCCYDAEGELIVGSVLTQGLREIWDGPSLAGIRKLHLSSQFEKIPICSRCRNWQ
ncbi:MAG TPA: radical SAM/SPASM domain-containing protein, partial [Thermodesulfovibrionales bacterium]|nr:radical SAM/SPASM domain-containing protein [Thermodesulfovibrionales bacterium]